MGHVLASPAAAAAQLPLFDPALTGRIILWSGDGAITRADLLRDALRLAARLPDRRWVANLCDDRHRFLLGFLAAILRGQITLLPNDRTVRVLAALAADHPGLYVLADAAGDDLPAGAAGLEVWAVRPEHNGGGPVPAVPFLPAARVVARVFTSGTTGHPVPTDKSWGWCMAGARCATSWLGLGDPGGPGASGSTTAPATAVVATVPSQHVYGLENTVLLPLAADVAVHTGRPFFPADVAAALATVPAPRLLVTTPVHLRVLVESGPALPPLARIVSATADLPVALARRAEDRFGAPVTEIYGCSEVGLVATRRPVETEEWRLRGDCVLDAADGCCQVRAALLPQPVPLNDIIEPTGPGRFRLQGRQADLINIAGKRASLAGLNAILAGIEGVADGAFFQPDAGNGERSARLIAFVVAPARDLEAIRTELRGRIDPAFLPRRMYRVARLPRDPTGKLTRDSLMALARSLREDRP